jgi:hypothetical protein
MARKNGGFLIFSPVRLPTLFPKEKAGKKILDKLG